MKARIEGIGTYRLILDTECHLDLEKCLYVPHRARNLGFVGNLNDVGFPFKIGNSIFSFDKHMCYYGSCTLMDGLYHFNLNVEYAEFLFNIEHSLGSKQRTHNENSAFL